jgi:outer membrane protein TolC
MGAMPDDSKLDQAVERVRNRFDEAASETEQMTQQAKREVEAAIDDLEAEIEDLRNRS